MKKIISIILSGLLVLSLFGCNNSNKFPNGKVVVYNFGDYMSQDAISKFENETGIQVVQDVFEANEEAQPIIESGAEYDVVCLSEYMIERLGKKGYFEELDLTKIPYYININDKKLDIIKACDPDNKWAVPYFCGEMGIIYNKTILDEKGLPEPTKWSDLWNPVYKGELLMQSSVRDLYTVALHKNGWSINDTNKEHIDKCTEDFIEQKPLVQAYMTDQVKEKILSGEASIAPIVSGDAQYVWVEGGQDEYRFIIPEGNSDQFIDAWVILKSSQNKENAYKFIDYMCGYDAAKLNAQYIGYESVNNTTPDEDYLEMYKRGCYKNYSNGNVELERDIGDAIRYYTDGYNKVKAK